MQKKTKTIGGVKIDLKMAKAIVEELGEGSYDYGIKDDEVYYYVSDHGGIRSAVWQSIGIDYFRHSQGVWKEKPTKIEVRDLKRLNEIVNHEINARGVLIESTGNGYCFHAKTKNIETKRELVRLMLCQYTFLIKK